MMNHILYLNHIYDENLDKVVIDDQTDYLHFRISNPDDPGNTRVTINQAIVTFGNQAANMNIYPVLKGRGAAARVIEPGDHVDFRLVFNCISQ